MMKASESTTSLSDLVVCDTGCHFCSEGNDTESGNLLVDSRDFLTCKCRFAFHRPCWSDYIEGSDSARCPICGEGIQTKIIHTVVVEDTKEREERSRRYQVGVMIISCLLITGFVVSLAAVTFKKN